VSYKIHPSVEKWAANLLNQNSKNTPIDEVKFDNPIKTQFDLYYMFLLVGLGKGKSANISGLGLSEFIKHVTEPYQEYKYLLAGLLLSAELTHSGMSLEKKMVQQKVLEMLRADSGTFLSNDANDLMNGYAYNGFEIVREAYGSVPANSHEFLIWFNEVMLPDCFSSPEWSLK